MRDLDRLIVRFRQFGGIRLVWEYAKMGVLWVGVKEVVRCAIKGRSFKSVYPVVTRLIDKELVNKYGNVNGNANHYSKAQTIQDSDCENENRVWFCWLQGIENAPELVKACLRSIKRNVTEDVVVIDEKNYTDYVTLPEYIVEKYRKGIIPPALFSDLLRLELLIHHGGTWIDSTVFTTGNMKDEKEVFGKFWQEIQKSELFLYRYIRNGRVHGISNWFIHAKAGNPLLIELRDMLYAYWRDYNCTVEYYIFHVFFGVLAKRHPEMMRNMPMANSYKAIILAHNLDKPFDEEWWQKLTANVPFHKLNYRKEPKEAKGTFFQFIIDMYK